MAHRRPPQPPDIKQLRVLDLLREAVRAVPVVRYALGIAGVAVVVLLLRSFAGGLQTGIIGVAVVLVLMTVLLVMAWVAKLAGSSIRVIAMTFLCLMLVAFFIPLGFAISSFFFCWPRNWCETPPHPPYPPVLDMKPDMKPLYLPELGLQLGVSVRLGTVVLAVESNGPAFKAGLQADDVIVAIDERNIGGEDDLRQALRKGGSGSRFSFRRGNDTKTVVVDCPTCKVN